MLAFVEHRHKDAVHSERKRGQAFNGTKACGGEVEPVPPSIARVANSADQAPRRQPLEHLGGGGAIERHPLAERFLVDVLLRAQRIQDRKLRGRDGPGDLSIPEPVMHLLSTSNQVAGVAAQVFVRG